MEKVSSENLKQVTAFLKAHEDYSLFLLGNLKNYGENLSEAPYSGNYKLIRTAGEVVAVFCLTKTGNLLIQSTIREPIFEKVLEACLEESIPLRGLLGDWEFCNPFWQYLKAKNIIQKELFASKEILYSKDLQHQTFPLQPNVRLLRESDYDSWRPLRLNYLGEEKLPNDLSDQQALDEFLEKTRTKTIWGNFQNNTLVSVADLNAKALDLGQVGGVFTAPQFRQKGYSKAVMMQLLRDSKELHSIRKLIIFTGESNFPAQKLYQSLGVSKVGYYALLFGHV